MAEAKAIHLTFVAPIGKQLTEQGFTYDVAEAVRCDRDLDMINLLQGRKILTADAAAEARTAVWQRVADRVVQGRIAETA